MPANLTTTGPNRQIFRRFIGDSGPDLDMTLEGGGALTGLNKPSSEILIWRDRFPTAVLSGNLITVINATLGTVTLDVSSWLATATVPGDWKVAVHAVFAADDYTYPWDVIRLERAG